MCALISPHTPLGGACAAGAGSTASTRRIVQTPVPITSNATVQKVPHPPPYGPPPRGVCTQAVRVLLGLAAKHDVPLLFVTNNLCNSMLKFEDAQEVEQVRQRHCGTSLQCRQACATCGALPSTARGGGGGEGRGGTSSLALALPITRA